MKFQNPYSSSNSNFLFGMFLLVQIKKIDYTTSGTNRNFPNRQKLPEQVETSRSIVVRTAQLHSNNQNYIKKTNNKKLVTSKQNNQFKPRKMKVLPCRNRRGMLSTVFFQQQFCLSACRRVLSAYLHCFSVDTKFSNQNRFAVPSSTIMKVYTVGFE